MVAPEIFHGDAAPLLIPIPPLMILTGNGPWKTNVHIEFFMDLGTLAEGTYEESGNAPGRTAIAC